MLNMKSVYFKADSRLIKICEKAVEGNIFSQKIVFGKIVTGEA